ncbi:anchored repeat ABC transporter, substrate-binding protein [Corynebacterium lipophiloflavum]|uniref:Anchored repeat ABC transporter, substrate-binding protein n=1 Tax=Corynebacterium lipophiloflavum (strain ATCC 700352 / DSM 44291 / CCUG 37336 / JCM 10383 / DMMZ 1944) TaxID=525263 RepID=C0XUJ1_CORLD|nr:anchored repeat ABC transporter, substrate-binding protein [Corynebacterium lipophiloflavum DSM 44291]
MTGASASSEKLQVVASTSILADVVRSVAGEAADITGLMPSGVDPHTYEPSLHATRDIAYADAVFTNGLLLEPQSLTRTVNATVRPGVPVVAVAEDAQRYGFSPIPLVEDASLDTVWLGLKVVTKGDLPLTAVADFTLTAAEGPGEASAFVLGIFGTPEVLFNTRDGIDTGDSTTLPVDAHTHVSWAFSAPGVYTLTFSSQVRDSVASKEVRDVAQETVTVVVGVDPAQAAPGATVIEHGHVDIATVVEPPAGKIVLRGDTPPDTDLNDAVIVVPNTTLQPIPPERAFRFLGNPGDETYLLPQAVLGRHVHGELDPHIWHDVASMKAVVNVVRDTLSSADPAHADVYAANASAYQSKLNAADEQMRAAVDSVPPANRNLVTTHHGYSYLGRAYGMTIAGSVTPNPSVQASPRDLMALTRTLQNLDVPAVFLEPELVGRSNELTETAAHLGVRVCTIRGDSLDPPGTGPATTYVDMIRANAEQVGECLKDPKDPKDPHERTTPWM